MQARTANIITLLCLGSAAALFVFTMMPVLTAGTGGPQLHVVSVDTLAERAAGGHVLGPADAAIVIVEFSDFQCPFCAESSTQLRELRDHSDGKVSVLFRHFPLDGIHPQASAAAVAATCAASQNRFEEYHRLLFQNQDVLKTLPWMDLAREAAMPDTAAFAECMMSEDAVSQVTADAALGVSVGVRATPTYVFAGRMVSGLSAVDSLRSWTSAAVKRGHGAEHRAPLF